MRIRAGTSGFSYPEWKGTFYPDDIADGDMLRHYAERLPAVEINNTFYRMPKSAVMDKWAAQVADLDFRFVIKASRRITHIAKLVDTAELIGYLHGSIAHLGNSLGPVFFQLPKYVRADHGLLAGFLSALPSDMRAVVEFKHPGWDVPATAEVLREHGAARCLVDDQDVELPASDTWATADVGYLRLRRPGYDDDALADILRRVRAQPWSECYVFFKHEDAGAGPRLARRLLDLAADVTRNG